VLVGLFDIFLEVLMTDVNRLPVLVSLQHLSFQFADGETLLDDLNLCIDHTPTGIVGRNGRGKSILARLIAGRLDLESIVAFEQALKGFTGAMVVVSHDEGFVQAIEPTHTLVWQSTGWRLVAV